MFKKVNTKLDATGGFSAFIEREKEIEKFWNDNKIFEKSLNERDKRNSFVFYDGPPTANGKPHIGHVETRAFKDLIPRYHTMKGSFVPRKAGWDTHGLPVELEVEKKLNLDSKKQIEEYGIAPFIEECKTSVWKYKEMWEEFSKRVAFWADMDNPYITYEDNYIESIWWALKTIWEKGLLYKGFKTVPYCPRCGTPLSSHEVAQGYELVKDTTAIARFKCVDEDAYMLAWTTTPWTLPSNVGLCVNANFDYVKVKAIDGNTYYLAKELCDNVFAKFLNDEIKDVKQTYEILETFKGSKLEGKKYISLFDCTKMEVEKKKGKAFFVTCDDYVTLTDGTGIVHIAPAFGEDDSRVGKKYELAFVQFVDEAGKLTSQTPFAGIYVKDADKLILEDLEKRGLLFSTMKVEHDYPHCWRCHTPLIYYARETWFIKMTAVKDEMIKNNNMINWVPESVGKGRFGDWLNNLQDWGISRNRYWGTPLNIWECECGHREAIGSIKELKEKSTNYDQVVAETEKTGIKFNLHRPHIDKVKIKCPHCGKEMTRVPEVIDCWFDSGAMPYAQQHYPFENKEVFEQQFPADFICEAVDQTRGWFYSLLAESTLLFNKPCFKNVLVLGHVVDKDGKKMSKSKGNSVDPMDALNTYGSDGVRWFFYKNCAPWLPKRFYGQAVSDEQNKFLVTLNNAYAFFVLYANIDNFDPTKYKLDYNNLNMMDKWLFSRLNTLIKNVDNNLSELKVMESADQIDSFVDELSNWYIRRNRERFWAHGMEQDKINAYLTLWTALSTLSKIIAPFTPFIAEEIFRNLVYTVDKSVESVHLAMFPTCDESQIDIELERKMNEAIKITALGRSARNEANIKNRQPLNKVMISKSENLSDYFLEIIRMELNCKSIEALDDISEYSEYVLKPQLKTLGPKYGKNLGLIKDALSKADANKLLSDLNKNGKVEIVSGDFKAELTKDDILVEAAKKGGYVTALEGSTVVVLDTNITEELKEEGFMREVIARVQNMRKEADFEVMDLIKIYIKSDDAIKSLISKNEKMVTGDCMAKEIIYDNASGFVKDWEIDGKSITIGVEKIK